MSVDIVTVSNVAFPCRNFIPLRNDLSPPFARIRLFVCLDYIPDAVTGLLSPISYALQRGILLRRENPTYGNWAPVAAATRIYIKRQLFSHKMTSILF